MKPIPKAVISRLPLYVRHLEDLAAEGVRTVSSGAIARSLGLTDAQVRRDLATFGTFGRPGIGYPVAELGDALRAILGLDRTWQVALVGYGNLGRALLAYGGFPRKAFRIVAVFDSDPAKIGRKAGDLVVEDGRSLAGRVRRLHVPMAILAVPAAAAQEAAWQLVRAGVRGILNFAPVRLEVPDPVVVDNIDFAVSLKQLSFHVRARGGEKMHGSEPRP